MDCCMSFSTFRVYQYLRCLHNHFLFLLQITDTLEVVDGCKQLAVKELKSPTKDIPPHHIMCSPGTSPIKTPYLSPREAYEMGMRKPKETWSGMSVIMPCISIENTTMIIRSVTFCRKL